MADLLLTDAKVFLGAHDITGQMNAVSLDAAVELQDATVFGATTRQRAAGLKTVALGVEGKVDGATVDKALSDGIGVADVPVSVLPVPTAGEVAYLFRCVQGDYSLGGQVGELMRFSAGAEASGGTPGLLRGTLMIDVAAVAASGNGAAFQLGALSAGQSLHAALHVFAASAGDTLDVIIESDDDEEMSTPTTRIAFAQVGGGAIGSQWLSVAGAITDDWWRVRYTIAGDGGESFNFAVTIGIK